MSKGGGGGGRNWGQRSRAAAFREKKGGNLSWEESPRRRTGDTTPVGGRIIEREEAVRELGGRKEAVLRIEGLEL